MCTESIHKWQIVKYNDHDADSVCLGITVCIVPFLVLIMSFSDLPTAKRKLVFLFLY